MEPQEIRVECHSALAAETPILIDDQIITMNQLHIGYSGQDVETFGINPNKNYIVDECHIMEVPQEIYTQDIADITFATGFHFQCTPGTLIATPSGFVPVYILNKGSKIYMILFNSDNGEFYYGEETEVTDINIEKKILQVPVYLFISEFENILLPNYNEGSNMIGFINIKQ